MGVNQDRDHDLARVPADEPGAVMPVDDEDFAFPSWNQPLRAHWDPVGAADRPRGPRTPRRDVRRRSRLGDFVAAYGWRAYAIPVLLALTIWVIVDAVTPAGAVEAEDEPSLGERSAWVTGIVGAPVGDGTFDSSIASIALPAGGAFTKEGTGEFRTVPGTTDKVGAGDEFFYTYSVDVEEGVDTAAYGGDEAFGRMVDATLANPKSWINDERFAFERVDGPDADFHVSLTSEATVREICGYQIEVETSCFNADASRVVLNEPRWVRGAVDYQGDIGAYRQYMINHEVGHAIGYADHQSCESDGGLAPVMMQQTFGTSNHAIAKLDPEGVVPDDEDKCNPNPWPYPRG